MKELNRRLTDKEAMNFFIQVLQAVHHLHNLGIIHIKDLKGKMSYQRCSICYLIVIIVVVVILLLLLLHYY